MHMTGNPYAGLMIFILILHQCFTHTWLYHVWVIGDKYFMVQQL